MTSRRKSFGCGLVNCAQELREARAHVTTVGVDVLPEQRHLADALRGEALDLGQDLAGTARGLAPANGRDDAVGADRVAAHGDLHPGLEAALAPDGTPSGEGPLLSGAERAASDSLAADAEPVAQMRDRAGAERDVDVRIEREQALSLRLGIAAADGDNRSRPLALQLRGVPHVGGEPRVGLLTDRAGVEDDHIRLFLRGRLAQAELLKQALDPLGVVGVHLAAERRDVVPLHGP